MKIYRTAFLLLIAAIALGGCSRKASERADTQSESLKPASAHGSGAPAASVSEKGLRFSAPSGWIAESPTSPSRLAQYKLPRIEGDAEDAELAVYHFPGGGGTPQANVDRWIGQFTQSDGSPASSTAKVLRKTIASIPVTIVDVSGTYAGSMMMMQQPSQPKTHFRMLAAIAETNNGLWFFKLTGPENTVKKWQSSFDTFLNSIQ